MSEKKSTSPDERFTDLSNKPITSTELEYILEINKKSVSIYNEVAGQNEDIISLLEKIDAKVEDIKTNVLRLTVFLGAIGVGTIIQFIIQLMHK